MVKEELEAKAKEAMKFNKVDKIHVVTDGTAFLPEDKSAALDYARKLKGEHKVVTFSKDKKGKVEESEEKPLAKMTVEELKKFGAKNRIRITEKKKDDIVVEIEMALAERGSKGSGSNEGGSSEEEE